MCLKWISTWMKIVNAQICKKALLLRISLVTLWFGQPVQGLYFVISFTQSYRSQRVRIPFCWFVSTDQLIVIKIPPLLKVIKIYHQYSWNLKLWIPLPPHLKNQISGWFCNMTSNLLDKLMDSKALMPSSTLTILTLCNNILSFLSKSGKTLWILHATIPLKMRKRLKY